MSVEDFECDWNINWQNKIISCEPQDNVKYTVTDFWLWARKQEASVTGVTYPRILDTDGMGPSYNVPRKVKLTKAYSIDSKSLIHLIGDESTLLDPNNKVLVPDDLRKQNWWEKSYIQIILIVIAIISLILTVISIL